MYPRISDFINDVFNTSFEWPIQSYGFFLTLAFLLAALVLRSELKRKENEGLIHPVKKTINSNKGRITDMMLSLLLGFLIGFKLPAILGDYDLFVKNPQEALLSQEGSILFGLLGMALMVVVFYYQGKNLKKEAVVQTVHPYQLTAMLILIAAVTGIIGAKIFHQLENWQSFMNDPVEALLSFDGLTFYGGLITAAFFVAYYGEKQKISWRIMGDTVAPALILAYGIGRIGCHVAGDGDWGIVNTMPQPEWLSFLPSWVWAYDYPNNVLREGVLIPGCTGPYCYKLAQSVFPTPIYETSMSLLIFGILMGLRKKLVIPGQLFAIYLIFNGIERGLIEQIRVNNLMHFMGIEITQAQLISTILIVLGLALFFLFTFTKKQKNNADAT
ncbi:MAG: prolipoprotein diacylglyceryl transferase [Bacteroidetes bacterium]|nr:prolipoprotein diacylglyceryl transferase [Bacteroidota bacterium]MBU1580089.1 prolipoprotein diacylglyceryl transferase [Bacteroidota bacterium]MBU2465021.1 prolipoprotein diacylglyceryl transferase [Bacteroidota bacterium]MBU2556659.1 prolipoprotein diacylglyceryl transferase [Bacteroidota bacterium]